MSQTSFKRLQIDGDSLRKAREDKGLSQDNVARFLGITQAAVSAMENNPQKLSFARVLELAELYELPLAWFATEKARPGESLVDIAFELRRYGIGDVEVSHAVPPIFLRRPEEVLCLALRGTPSPRVIDGLPVIILINDWSPILLRGFAEHFGILARVAWIVDAARTILDPSWRLPFSPEDVRDRCGRFLDGIEPRPRGADDSIGVPTENFAGLSRVHRRWGITYAQTLEELKTRAAYLIEARR